MEEALIQIAKSLELSLMSDNTANVSDGLERVAQGIHRIADVMEAREKRIAGSRPITG